MELGDVAVTLSLNDAALRRGLAGVRSRMGAFGSRMARTMRRAGRVAGLALVAGLAVGVKAGADFEDAMAKSVAIMGDLSTEMRDKMETAARQVALTTSLSAKDAADSYFYLASAGLDAAQSIAALPKVAAFAQAGNFDMAQATDLLTDAQSALGMTIRDDVVKNMENMTRVSDVLVKANTMANASVEQFATSLTTKVGASFRTVGKDVEEAVAVLAALADQGIKSQLAGTQLAMMMTQLSSAAVKNKEDFAAMNIAVFDGEGEMRHMADIVADLEGALGGLSDEAKVAAIMQLGFSDRTANTLKTLIGTSAAIRTYDEGLRDAADTTQTVAEKQLESFNAQLGLVKDAFLDIGLSIFDGFVKPLSTSLIPKIGDAARAIGEFVALIDERGLRGAFDETFGPEALPGFDKFMEGVDGIRESVGKLWDSMGEFWRDIKPKLMELGQRILPTIRTTIEKIETAWESVKPAVTDLTNAILTLGTALLDMYNGDWSEAWDGMKEDPLAVKIAIGAIILALGRLGIAVWVAQANFVAATTGSTGMVIAAKQVTAAVVGIKAALVTLVTTPWVLTLGIAVLAPLGLRRLMDELTGGGKDTLPWDIPLPWEEPTDGKVGMPIPPADRPPAIADPPVPGGRGVIEAANMAANINVNVSTPVSQQDIEDIRGAVLEGAAAAGLMR